MKSEKEIQEQLSLQEIQLVRYTSKHKDLNQIDMLSGEGVQLRENINKTKGFINALKWILGND